MKFHIFKIKYYLGTDPIFVFRFIVGSGVLGIFGLAQSLTFNAFSLIKFFFLALVYRNALFFSLLNSRITMVEVVDKDVVGREFSSFSDELQVVLDDYYHEYIHYKRN